jgi:hypothetical protein
LYVTSDFSVGVCYNYCFPENVLIKCYVILCFPNYPFLDEVKRIIDIFLERHNIELVKEHFILDVHEGEITKDLLN